MTTPCPATYPHAFSHVQARTPQYRRGLVTRVGTAAALWLLPAMASMLSGCLGYAGGNGDRASEDRSVGEFRSVRTEGPVDIELTIGGTGDHSTITVTCDSNLLELIDTDVVDGQLVIDTPPGIAVNPRTTCAVKASAVQTDSAETTGSGNVVVLGVANGLRSLRSTGSGDIDVDLVQGDRLEVKTTGSGGVYLATAEVYDVEAHATGSGDIELGGVVDRLDLKTSGSGDLFARNVMATSVTAKTTGSGNIQASASGSADCQTSGSGDIEVWGNPTERQQSSTGSGDVYFR